MKHGYSTSVGGFDVKETEDLTPFDCENIRLLQFPEKLAALYTNALKKPRLQHEQAFSDLFILLTWDIQINELPVFCRHAAPIFTSLKREDVEKIPDFLMIYFFIEFGGSVLDALHFLQCKCDFIVYN